MTTMQQELKISYIVLYMWCNW